MRLLRVELTRLRWRRAVLLLLLLAVALPLLIGASRVWSTRPVSESEIAGARQSGADDIARCADHPRRYGLAKDATDAECSDLVVSWYTGREKLSLASERTEGPGMTVVAVLTALLLLAGTTFAGHDWNSGSMSNQLLFQPRRGRVWTAKALAVTLVALLSAAVMSTAYWLGIWGVMRMRDLPVADGSVTDSLAFGLRGAGFAAAAALGGYALTMLFRSTVATVGVLFAVSIAGGLLIALLGFGDQWQPPKNAAAIVKNGTTYYVDPPQSCYSGRPVLPADQPECDPMRELSVWHGLGYYGSALVVAVGASVLTFRRRDVP